ncbi:spore protease YyaC [Paenibacillus senegalensis]|uniref:spore protease YyaC n=1 Tax=Paenibacillus senegalensis TaxID=1465766 RepID=UPI000289126A|nr:spore protease YyaC [Paenibacillus senegalensis]
MAGSFIRKTIGGEKLNRFFEDIKDSGRDVRQILFLCIGTDRSAGDSFGPIVGTLLEQEGYPYVQGTLQRPCDANTLLHHLRHVPEGKTVIAIDACLGRDAASVGKFQVSHGPIEPGQSMGSRLPGVGDFSIGGIVNIYEGQPYRILQSTSLYRVLTMANQLVKAVKQAFPLCPGEAADELERSAEQTLARLASASLAAIGREPLPEEAARHAENSELIPKPPISPADSLPDALNLKPGGL